MTVPPFAFGRSSAPPAAQLDNLGLLARLSGTWVGGGFNLISKPGKDVGLDFVLQVNQTIETITFDPIGGPVPNRGSAQGDINIFGVTYLQQVSDATSGAGLHIERGMWLNVPSTTNPNEPQTIVRLSTIPHGDSVLAQGTGIGPIPAQPQIESVSPMPFNDQGPQGGGGYFPPPLTPPATNPSPLPPGFNLDNPNQALVDALRGQTIIDMVVLQVSTNQPNSSQPAPPPPIQPSANQEVLANLPFGGGVLNIPFVTTNANAVSLNSIFWIETVAPPAGSPPGTQPTMQLQYTQTVILNFLGINWPHISVATLVRH